MGDFYGGVEALRESLGIGGGFFGRGGKVGCEENLIEIQGDGIFDDRHAAPHELIEADSPGDVRDAGHRC